MVWAGRRFYVNGLRALAHGLPDMNSLVAVGTLAAFGFSLVATFRPLALTAAGAAPDVYYEAVAIIIAFVLTAAAGWKRARHQAVAALRGLAPCSRARRSWWRQEGNARCRHPGDWRRWC